MNYIFFEKKYTPYTNTLINSKIVVFGFAQGSNF